MEDIFVRLVKMPSKCKGCVSKGVDGYNIYINDALSFELQQETYKHEMDHIINDDFRKSVNDAEK